MPSSVVGCGPHHEAVEQSDVARRTRARDDAARRGRIPETVERFVDAPACVSGSVTHAANAVATRDQVSSIDSPTGAPSGVLKRYFMSQICWEMAAIGRMAERACAVAKEAARKVGAERSLCGVRARLQSDMFSFMYPQANDPQHTVGQGVFDLSPAIPMIHRPAGSGAFVVDQIGEFAGHVFHSAAGQPVGPACRALGDRRGFRGDIVGRVPRSCPRRGFRRGFVFGREARPRAGRVDARIRRARQDRRRS